MLDIELVEVDDHCFLSAPSMLVVVIVVFVILCNDFLFFTSHSLATCWQVSILVSSITLYIISLKNTHNNKFRFPSDLDSFNLLLWIENKTSLWNLLSFTLHSNNHYPSCFERSVHTHKRHNTTSSICRPFCFSTIRFHVPTLILGFLRSRRDKAKQKKAKKKSKDSVDNQSNKEEKSDL